MEVTFEQIPGCATEDAWYISLVLHGRRGM